MIELSYDAESPELPSDDILDAMREAGRAAVSERGIEDAEISLSFVPPDEIRVLNREHRGVDEVTDVLSFPMDGVDTYTGSPRPPVLLGDIVICPERAREQAYEYGHGEPREFVYLFVHGLFHLLGYDHETEGDRSEMRAVEEGIMRGVNL